MSGDAGTERDREFDFAALLPFVDVVYGATLGYAFVKIADVLQRIPAEIRQGSTQMLLTTPRTDLSKLGLQLLVLNYLIHDFSEARLYTSKYQYRGHHRFVLDLAIAGFFLLAFVAAESASAALFVPLALVFALGGWWALVLESEWGKKALYPYAQATVFSHFGAMTAALTAVGYFGSRSQQDTFGLSASEVGQVWIGYAIWASLVVALKLMLKLPHGADVDLLPVGVVGRLCIKCLKTIRDTFKRFMGWWKR